MRSPETAGAGGRRFGRGEGLVDRASPPENRRYFAAETRPTKNCPIAVVRSSTKSAIERSPDAPAK